MRTMGWVLIPGRAGKIRSLTLVLKGNIPRFPWEPSTTMLNYRLTGTTEQSVSYRDEPTNCAYRSTGALLELSTATLD